MRQESLMTLRARHFDLVEGLALSEESPEWLADQLTRHYDRYFGKLRCNSPRVPSDAIREQIIVWNLMARVETRRHEIQAANRHEHIAAHDECST